MTLRTDRITATAMGFGAVLFLQAQTTFQPDWVHTWPFGMDQMSAMTYAPPHLDNRVVVDPITGLVHATVSDENMLLSPRAELFHTFTPSGQELTPSPAPVIGNVPLAGLYNTPFNTIGLTDMTVYDGKLFSAHTYRQEGIGNGFDWGHFIAGGPIGADRWKIILGHSLWNTASHCLAVGPSAVVMGSPVHPKLYGFDHAGTFTWRTQLPFSPRQLVEHNGEVFALAGTTVQRLNMGNGEFSAQAIAMPPGVERFAVEDNVLYYTRLIDQEDVAIGKMDLNGQIIWEVTFPIGIYPVVSGLVVDAEDRTWVSCSLFDGLMNNTFLGGYLLGVDGTGQTLGAFTYGASLHGLATNGSMLFITGWSENTGTETFLLGVEINALLITTRTPVLYDPRTSVLHAWPNPTAHSLQLVLPEGTLGIELLDAQGRVVRTWRAGSASIHLQVGINDVAEGRYTLRANTADRVFRAGVVIMR